jgi:hypothetical protein
MVMVMEIHQLEWMAICSQTMLTNGKTAMVMVMEIMWLAKMEMNIPMNQLNGWIAIWMNQDLPLLDYLHIHPCRYPPIELVHRDIHLHLGQPHYLHNHHHQHLAIGQHCLGTNRHPLQLVNLHNHHHRSLNVA